MATTTKNLGIVSPVPADEWNASTTYQKLNIISHNNGSYIAKQGSTGIEPGVTTNWETYWMLLVSSTGGGGSGTTVVANPTLTGSEANLSGLQVGDTKYGIKALKVTVW